MPTFQIGGRTMDGNSLMPLPRSLNNQCLIAHDITGQSHLFLSLGGARQPMPGTDTEFVRITNASNGSPTRNLIVGRPAFVTPNNFFYDPFTGNPLTAIRVKPGEEWLFLNDSFRDGKVWAVRVNIAPAP